MTPEEITARINELTGRIDFLRSLKYATPIPDRVDLANWHALNEAERQRDELQAMKVSESWGSSEEYDNQRENERLDAMASLIIEARGYNLNGKTKENDDG